MDAIALGGVSVVVAALAVVQWFGAAVEDRTVRTRTLALAAVAGALACFWLRAETSGSTTRFVVQLLHR